MQKISSCATKLLSIMFYFFRNIFHESIYLQFFCCRVYQGISEAALQPTISLKTNENGFLKMLFTKAVSSASFLSIYFDFYSRCYLSNKIYNKHDEFNFEIVSKYNLVVINSISQQLKNQRSVRFQGTNLNNGFKSGTYLQYKFIPD